MQRASAPLRHDATVPAWGERYQVAAPILRDATMHKRDTPAVFRLDGAPIRLRVSDDDRVTAVAASHGTVWAGTQQGRLFRYDGGTGELSEAKVALSGGTAVRRIYTDERSRAVLVFVTSADAFHARAAGPLRPRLVTRLRGLRCSAATWVPTAGKGERHAALLGSALGSLFMLTFDDDNERDDNVERLWIAPDAECIIGIRIERVAGKLVGIVATATKLYVFSDAASLSELFATQNICAIQLVSDLEHAFPTELHFMSGESALASRRFVWAGTAGVTHAQLAVRRRRIPRPTTPPAAGAGSAPTAAVVASLVDKASISWGSLKDASGASAPIAVNLSAWHVLVLYADSIYAYNHISGSLTERLDVWSPSSELRESRDEADPGAVEDVESALLGAPAAGLARDVGRDVLWIYSGNGQLARVVAGEAQNRDAWQAATDVGRFDLAMALAPLVARSGVPADVDAVATTRQAVLRAQAEHAASGGDWEAAATLFAKTEKPVEEVILAIVEAAQREDEREAAAEGGAGVMDVEKKGRMVSYIIEYLVRKLDQVDASRHTQRTLIATVLVQLYAGRLSGEVDEDKREKIRRDFGNFLADHHPDLDVPTALSVLANHGCIEDGKTLARLASRPRLALGSAVQRMSVDDAVALLSDASAVADTVAALSQALVHIAPERVTRVLADAADVDHLVLVSSLMRTARTSSPAKRQEAYDAAISHARTVLQQSKVGSEQWSELIKFLFASHSEFADQFGAARTVQTALSNHPPHVLQSPASAGALACALRSCLCARFARVAIDIYILLGQEEAAVILALDVDPSLAERTLLAAIDLSNVKKKSLWQRIAARAEDPVAVAARSGGVLAVHDVLDGMGAFNVASEPVKRAVASELRENRRVATTAHAAAQAATAATDRLRADLRRAHEWRTSRNANAVLACGHPSADLQRNGMAPQCPRCGEDTIDSIDRAFDDIVPDV